MKLQLAKALARLALPWKLAIQRWFAMFHALKLALSSAVRLPSTWMILFRTRSRHPLPSRHPPGLTSEAELRNLSFRSLSQAFLHSEVSKTLIRPQHRLMTRRKFVLTQQFAKPKLCSLCTITHSINWWLNQLLIWRRNSSSLSKILYQLAFRADGKSSNKTVRKRRKSLRNSLHWIRRSKFKK